MGSTQSTWGHKTLTMSVSAQGKLGGAGVSVTVNLSTPSHHDEDDFHSPPRPPVRPTERSDLETNIQDVVEREMELMFEELKDEERIQEDVTMNEMELLRLKLKYKYKYKYKYEVKKRQDRSTPLLGDSWDLDPAITQGGMGTGFDDSVALGQDSAMSSEEMAEEPPVLDIKIPADEFTLTTLVETARLCKQELDRVWVMMGPP